MPKVLEMEQKMSNAEVLDFLKQTRLRHQKEDADDIAAGLKLSPRPQNYLDALTKHERHLKSSAYPYEKNPSAYEGKNQDVSLRKFNDEHFDKIHVPVFEKFKDLIKKKLIEANEGAEQMEQEQLRKEISEEELLMIHNHAPRTVELLQPMLENVEERYTVEELQIIVDVIKDVYLRDELAAKEATVESITEQLSGLDAFAARPAPSGGESVDYAAPMAIPLPLRPLSGPRWSGANAEPLGRSNRLSES